MLGKFKVFGIVALISLILSAFTATYHTGYKNGKLAGEKTANDAAIAKYNDDKKVWELELKKSKEIAESAATTDNAIDAQYSNVITTIVQDTTPNTECFTSSDLDVFNTIITIEDVVELEGGTK